MTLNGKKMHLLVIVIVILFGISLIIVTGKVMMFVPIGPGVPPSEYLPQLMISGNDAYSVCSEYKDQERTLYFTPVGERENENYRQFPPLSPFSSYRLFRDENTNTTLIISVWYFNSQADFRAAQQNLLAFLKENGTVNSSDLEIGNKSTICGATGNTPRDSRFNSPNTIRVTSFAGSDESGIFLTNSRPLIPTRDDYFIQYVGVINSTDLSGNTGEIKNLVAAVSLNQRYFLNGEVDELS
jgi:hypothetical protein